MFGWLGLAAPSEAAQRAGARYDGRPAGSSLFALQISPTNPARIIAGEFEVRLRCNDGRGLLVVISPSEATEVTAAGTFSFSGRQALTTRRPSGRRVSGAVSISASGAFSPNNESVTGRAAVAFTSSTVSCSTGSFGYTLYLDGTRGAPFRGARLATGSYRMSAGGRGVRFPRAMRTWAPSSEILTLQIRSRVRCRNGGSFPGADEFVRMRVKRGAAGERRGFSVRRGSLVNRVRSRLRLRFFRRNGYRVRGTWRVSAVVFDNARAVDRCFLRKRLSGRLRSGPRNLF